MQLVAFTWRRYAATMTGARAHALFELVQWLGFTSSAETLAEEFVEQCARVNKVYTPLYGDEFNTSTNDCDGNSVT